MDIRSVANRIVGFNNRTLVVALHVAAPFVVYDKAKVGNARFRGLTIDVLEQIAKDVRAVFIYVLLTPTSEPNNTESSAAALDAVQFAQPIKEVGGRKADLAAGAISISSKRSNSLAFTMPYYDGGFVMVTKMPENPVNPTGFFDPFHDSLWFFPLFFFFSFFSDWYP